MAHRPGTQRTMKYHKLHFCSLKPSLIVSHVNKTLLVDQGKPCLSPSNLYCFEGHITNYSLHKLPPRISSGKFLWQWQTPLQTGSGKLLCKNAMRPYPDQDHSMGRRGSCFPLPISFLELKWPGRRRQWQIYRLAGEGEQGGVAFYKRN